MWVTVVIGTLLVFFFVLTSLEENRGSRFLLTGARVWLDKKLVSLYYWLSHLKLHLGSTSLQMLFHFFAHRLLGWLLNILKSTESLLDSLHRRNRLVAKSVKEVRDKNHLDLIAEHKASTALTPAERQELKEKSIEG